MAITVQMDVNEQHCPFGKQMNNYIGRSIFHSLSEASTIEVPELSRWMYTIYIDRIPDTVLHTRMSFKRHSDTTAVEIMQRNAPTGSVAQVNRSCCNPLTLYILFSQLCEDSTALIFCHAVSRSGKIDTQNYIFCETYTGLQFQRG